jgi:hypothetical protein
MSQFQGDDCGINEFQSSNNSDTRFAVRQTGEEFRSEAPPDCRLVVCGTDGTVPATITTTVAPTTTTTTIAPAPTAAVQPTTTTPVTTDVPITIATVPPITIATVPPIPTAVPPTTVAITVPQTAVPPTTTTPVPPTTTTPVPTAAPVTTATVPPIPTTVPPTTFAITVPQTPTSAQVSDEPENQLVHQRIVPFGVEDAMVIKQEEILEESILQQGQSTSDILNNVDDSDSDENEIKNEIENDIDDIRITSEIAPIYVRPVLNQAFYNPTYYRNEK